LKLSLRESTTGICESKTTPTICANHWFKISKVFNFKIIFQKYTFENFIFLLCYIVNLVKRHVFLEEIFLKIYEHFIIIKRIWLSIAELFNIIL